MVTNRITGFLPSRVMFFLSNLHIIPRQIFLVRHGQSQYNLKKLLGGDSSLTPLGVQFAVALKEFVCSEIDDPEQDLCVWSSTMIRTIQTAEDIPCVQYVRWKALEEIQVCFFSLSIIIIIVYFFIFLLSLLLFFFIIIIIIINI